MNNEQMAEMLKEKIYEVENSKKLEDVGKRIITVHLDADVFLKMAYLFVGINNK